MDNSGQFNVKFQQVGPFHFSLLVTNPYNVSFTTICQARPEHINNESILDNFKNCDKKQFKELWNIEAEIIKSEVIQDIKPSEPLEQTKTEEVSKQEIKPEENKTI